VRSSGADSQSADESNEAVDGGGTREGASFSASLAKMDFQALADPDEMRAVEALVDRLARQMRKRAIRRQRVSKNGKKIHLRKTLRGSLRFGGTPLLLSYRERVKRQPRLVLATAWRWCHKAGPGVHESARVLRLLMTNTVKD